MWNSLEKAEILLKIYFAILNGKKTCESGAKSYSYLRNHLTYVTDEFHLILTI